MRPIVLLLGLVAAAALAAEQPHRVRAEIQPVQPGAFVQLPLPPSAYAHSLQPNLADLRVVDATGARVPFALLPPRKALQHEDELLRTVSLFALPRRAAPGAAIGLPLQVEVQGDRVRVRPIAGSTAAAAPRESPGWLIDLGEADPAQPVPRTLRLAWAEPAEFSAAFDLDTSAALRSWRSIGGGQVLSLPATGGALVQRDVPLPAGHERFLRLVWRDAAAAPRLTGAQAVALKARSEERDPLLRLDLQPGFEPARDGNPAALHVDLGGPLPLRTLALQLPPGTQVLPVRVQARNGGTEAWRDIASGVFYRLQRENSADSVAPPLPLHGSARYLRVQVDARSAPPDPSQTRVLVQVAPLSLVYAAQGTAPHTLLAGSADATPGALPLATLVPDLERERPRFGRAALGPWVEDSVAAQAADRRATRARLKPALLWAVLIGGVAALGFVVWRLARQGRAEQR